MKGPVSECGAELSHWSYATFRRDVLLPSTRQTGSQQGFATRVAGLALPMDVGAAMGEVRSNRSRRTDRQTERLFSPFDCPP
jgi:hypothetical protein